MPTSPDIILYRVQDPDTQEFTRRTVLRRKNTITVSDAGVGTETANPVYPGAVSSDTGVGSENGVKT